ncbi:hypothetical protein V1504DRAFT_65270 [Lipomyces starkeyi]
MREEKYTRRTFYLKFTLRYRDTRYRYLIYRIAYRLLTHIIAIQYRDRLIIYKPVIAFEVGVSQTYKSLQAAISWCVCALHCRLGIAMNITEKDRDERPTVKYYASRQEQGAAIQQARGELHLQLRRNPFGPLEWNNITWFGKMREVVIETFRNEDPNCPPEALLEPTQSFTIVRDGRFSEQVVPPNLREVVLGDCVPSHILNGNEIVGTPLDFFRRSWFETKIRAEILKTAIERVEE